ncbi:hypothetical protein K505DRAFT_199852, partial [Melanomma pulvis-pyrius CBS 109.77]
MPLTDRDPNTSGRTSRASNMSAGSRGLQKGHGAAGRSDLFSSTPAIMSMLRTSTEIGEIAGLPYDSSRGPSRRGASSRLSTCSSQSNTSRRASSSHQVRPSASSGAPRSTRDNNVPQYIPDTLSPTIMNLPCSSPLFPRSRDSRDKHRSLSMTNTSQPTFRLSANRSFASLRAHEPIQRPRSPYRYPTRLRRPGYRPASPALSDITGTHPKRYHGQMGHPRLRHPSDVSVHRDERAHRIPGQGHPRRNRSPTFLVGPNSDMPARPPLHHHIVVEQSRMLHRPAKGSVSSGSTNQRTDSEAPSSDTPSPPTPKEGRSIEALLSPLGTHMLMDNLVGVMKEDVSTGPLYYDYSEQFEREEYIEPEADPMPTGFVHHIKTILEERATINQSPKKVEAPIIREVVELPGSEVMDVAELPASPVPRRITRDMILAALEPVSTDGDIGASRFSMEDTRTNEPAHEQQEEQVVPEELGTSPLPPGENKDGRHSILSQTGASIMESSTLDFAVRYSIPMVTSNGAETETRPGSVTEDGMSDLLDGYQHTETKQEEQMDVENTADEPVERKSSHTPKSSDEQSFKSCTDLPEQSDKDLDTKSVKTTCKDVVTPERAISMPPSRFPSSNLAISEPKCIRPVSETPIPSPPVTVRRQPLIPPRESSFTKAHARLRANSKLSSRHEGSTVTSISSSIESPAQLPPVVPPRESSFSKEAQRTQAVADFLVRLSRHRRFSKAHSTFGRKQGKEEGVVKTDEGENVSKSDSPQEQQEVVGGSASSKPPLGLVKTPEKGLKKENMVPEKHIPAGVPSKKSASMNGSTPVKNTNTPTAPLVHQYSLSTPSALTPEPSSVYSPEDISSSSSSKARAQSSPVVFAKSPERGRRDSQTTTHLVWHGRKTSNLVPGNGSELRANQSNGQEDTTTDLRLSAYRYPLHYLPDLKEESHEDSSLNTSASNLKNSNFKFPPVRQPSVRMSGDDGFLLGRNPSTRSYQQSSLGQTRGLPSMNFSRMDLIGKLNEALDIRSSRSSDAALDNVHELAQSNPVRPSSAGEIREKYRSFFASLDELEKTGEATQPTTIMDLMPMKPPYSPVHLIAEIDRLTIPSVGGLTQRLSEFLPSLKEYYKLGEVGEFVAEEVIMENALEEINEVGGPAPKRSSARLRPMPGSPNMVVIDDALYDELTGKEMDHASPGASSVDDSPNKGVGGKGTRSITNAPPRDKTPLAELEAPSPAILRTRSLSAGHQDLRPSLESRLSSRRSLRSLIMSTPTATNNDTRPWNFDRNYPWATTVPAIDISLPSPALTRASPRPGPSRLREHLSDSTLSSASGPYDTPASRPGAMSMPGSNDRHTHARRQSRRFSIFSHSKRPNNPQPEGFDASGNATRPLRLREGDQSHDVGERYPFSA